VRGEFAPAHHRLADELAGPQRPAEHAQHQPSGHGHGGGLHLAAHRHAQHQRDAGGHQHEQPDAGGDRQRIARPRPNSAAPATTMIAACTTAISSRDAPSPSSTAPRGTGAATTSPSPKVTIMPSPSARIGGQQAAPHRDNRRLARAVGPQQPVGLAGADGEADASTAT
jgi:hypothetical protein